MGADKTVKNNDNQMPSDLSSDSAVISLLGGEGPYETKEENDQLPFIPNYLLHLPLVLDWSNEHTVVKAECTIRHENKDGATVNGLYHKACVLPYKLFYWHLHCAVYVVLKKLLVDIFVILYYHILRKRIFQ